MRVWPAGPPRSITRRRAWDLIGSVSIWIWVLVPVLLISGSCDDDPTGPFDTTPIVLLRVEPSGVSLSGVGSKTILSAAGQEKNGALVEKPKVTWSSLNPAVATVDPVSGEVSAVASGQTAISAKGKGATGFAVVTVSVPGLSPVREWRPVMGPHINLYDVWVHSPTDVFAVGSAASFLHFNGTTWTSLPGAPGSLDGLAGTAPDNLYSTFRDPAGIPYYVVRYDGSSWTVLEEARKNLKDLWAAPTGEVFVVGYNGGLQFDGTQWTPLGTDPVASFYGVAGTSAEDVYAVGLGPTNGALWRFDGANWSATFPGYPDRLFNVWAASPDNVFMTGGFGYHGVVRYNGETWVEDDLPTEECRGELWGSSANDVFAVGMNGAICRFDGSVWSEMESGSDIPLHDVDGSSPQNVFAVGEGGVVLRYDGSDWTTVRQGQGGARRSWRTVWGSSAENVLVLGDGSFGTFDGTQWTEHSEGIPGGIRDMWGASAGDVFAVSESGDVLHFDGVRWSEAKSGGENFNGVWGASPNDVWVVGFSGQVRRFDGTDWGELQAPRQTTLRTVWGTSHFDVISAGDGGSLFRHDGLGWTEEDTGTVERLNDIWGSSSDHVFIVGTKGTILHQQGTGWAAMDSGTDQDLLSVWGSSPTDVYAVGHNLILHFDGTSWNQMPQPIPEQVRYEGIWGSSGTDVFVVGRNSTILRGVR